MTGSNSAAPTNMGLQLFPPPPAQRAQRTHPVRRGVIQDQSAEASRSRTPDIPSDGRASAVSNRHGPSDGRQSAMNGRQSPYPVVVASPQQIFQPTFAQPPNPFRQEQQRSHTSMSDAPTLVRSNSNASHSSIAKRPFLDASSSRSPSDQAMIRSIFPRYNPEVPLVQQQYYPTQTSPTHIPHSAISRSQYHNADAASMRSPQSATGSMNFFGRRIAEDVATPKPCETEDLKQLWKVTNGWRVQNSEARSFCLKMTSAVDEPVHTFSSATQMFWSIRLDPTSTSALLTMQRQDPNKNSSKTTSPVIGSGKAKENNVIDVLSTTLEEPHRKLPPNDGLVALLYPKAAADRALKMASRSGADESELLEAAEFECGRLVWDEDTGKYYLCHPATTYPFVFNINSSPAWSRVEYTLEHPELPINMVKLVRDGAGGGYLEVDTGAAARIDSFFLLDVAVCAIVLVALEEEKTQKVERFDAPPMLSPVIADSPKAKSVLGFGAPKKQPKIEEMEIDLESQNSSWAEKEKGKQPKEKTPGALRALVWVFKAVFWVFMAFFKCLASCIMCCSGCVTKKS